MNPRNAPTSWRRRLAVIVLALLVLVAGVVLAFRYSPWPGALLIRGSFDRDAERANAALARHVGGGIQQRLDVRYDDSEGALLDVYAPIEASGALPAIVWVHGGAWVSGDKRHLANYARILAGQGYVVASVGYAIAPGARYPSPVRQVSAALRHLSASAARYGLDANRLVLAGDSAGAQIAAQVANLVVDRDYAARVGIDPGVSPGQLRAVLLYCGAFDVESVNLDGDFGGFLRTVLWAYSGRRDFLSVPGFTEASVVRHVGARFPPAFISAGNGDPLLPQSQALAQALAAHGVRHETLFFPETRQPPLGHEYQFDLDGEPGRLALQRSLAFLESVLRDPPPRQDR